MEAEVSHLGELGAGHLTLGVAVSESELGGRGSSGIRHPAWPVTADPDHGGCKALCVP